MPRFDKNIMRLQNPDNKSIRNAYHELPKKGILEIRCKWDARLKILNQLELSGCFGLFISPSHSFKEATITALKGKSGLCYETGRSATYRGSAAAVLDDDNHFIYGSMRVCEKTANIYLLPVYKNLISVTDGEPDLIKKLNSSPVPFDCNTYESDLKQLVTAFQKQQIEYELDTPVLYQGPFRLLILSDGLILRRGVATLISRNQADILRKKDNTIILPSLFITEAVSPSLLTERYRMQGSACLLYGLEHDPKNTAENISEFDQTEVSEPDFSALESISDDLKNRIRVLIRNDEPYFILTGSDPGNQLGCCPNNLIGEANALIQKGILNSYKPPSSPNACTSTIYAFHEEIDRLHSPPCFNRNRKIRNQVDHLLAASQSKIPATIKGITRAAIGILFIGSLFLAVKRITYLFKPKSEYILYEDMEAKLSISKNHQLVLILFHGKEKCKPCMNMEDFAIKTLDLYFSDQVLNNRITVQKMRFDQSENMELAKRLGLSMSNIGLVRCENGRIKNLKLLTNSVWSLYENETSFIEMLKKEIASMLEIK